MGQGQAGAVPAIQLQIGHVIFNQCSDDLGPVAGLSDQTVVLVGLESLVRTLFGKIAGRLFLPVCVLTAYFGEVGCLDHLGDILKWIPGIDGLQRLWIADENQFRPGPLDLVHDTRQVAGANHSSFIDHQNIIDGELAITLAPASFQRRNRPALNARGIFKTVCRLAGEGGADHAISLFCPSGICGGQHGALAGTGEPNNRAKLAWTEDVPDGDFLLIAEAGADRLLQGLVLS